MRHENWPGIYDLLGPRGIEYAEADVPGFRASGGRDAFGRAIAAAIASHPETKESLLRYYGRSTVASIEGTDTGKKVRVIKDDGGHETLFVEKIGDRWHLTRFPMDWYRNR